VGVSDGGEPLSNALKEAVKSIATVKNIKNKRDLLLLIAEFDQRVTMAVENQVARKHCPSFFFFLMVTSSHHNWFGGHVFV